MLYLMNFFFFFIVPLCLLKFIMNLNHLFNSLLILELVSLFLFFSMGIMLMSLENLFLIYFLVMIVCEGVLGICLLVLLSFSYSMDYLFVLNKLMC